MRAENLRSYIWSCRSSSVSGPVLASNFTFLKWGYWTRLYILIGGNNIPTRQTKIRFWGLKVVFYDFSYFMICNLFKAQFSQKKSHSSARTFFYGEFKFILIFLHGDGTLEKGKKTKNAVLEWTLKNSNFMRFNEVLKFLWDDET